MDARLDTLNDELCQVNTCVSRIAQRQAVMGGFTASPSHLHRLLRMRAIMVATMMMLMMRMMVLALPVMRR